jgi:hypothetical protein
MIEITEDDLYNGIKIKIKESGQPTKVLRIYAELVYDEDTGFEYITDVALNLIEEEE